MPFSKQTDLIKNSFRKSTMTLAEKDNKKKSAIYLYTCNSSPLILIKLKINICFTSFKYFLFYHKRNINSNFYVPQNTKYSLNSVLILTQISTV